MADRLVVVERAPAHLQAALFRTHRAQPPTTRAALLLPQALGLLLRGVLQGAGGETAGRRDGDLFHGVQIDVQTGAILAKGTAGDDFAPLLGQLVDGFFIFLAELGSWHTLVS